MNRCWLESTAVNRSLISQADPLTYLAQTCDRTSEWANYFVVADMNRNIIGVFHKSLTEIITVKGLEPATSCVREQDVTTVPSRHMWETGSLNWSWFMIQRFIKFPEFAEFSESSAPFRKNSMVTDRVFVMLNWSSRARGGFPCQLQVFMVISRI